MLKFIIMNSDDEILAQAGDLEAARKIAEIKLKELPYSSDPEIYIYNMTLAAFVNFEAPQVVYHRQGSIKKMKGK